MPDAPERIFLDGDVEAGWGMFPRCFENPKYASKPAVEYVRADLYAALLAERDAAFAAGQEERRVALVYDEAGNVEVYADKGVTIISVCDHTPGDRLYRLNPASIPDGMLDGHIGHAGDETRADRLATAAAEAIADGVDVLADPGAVFSKVRSN